MPQVQVGGGWIWKKYKDNLLARFDKDPSCGPEQRNATSLPVEFTHVLVDGKLKRHSHHALVPWIIESYLHKGIRRFEDIRVRTIPALDQVQFLSSKGILDPADRDVTQFCGIAGCKNARGSIPGLEDMLKKYQDHKPVQPIKLMPIYEDELCKIYHPATKEESCKLGRGTRWCTSGKKDNYFDVYNKDGPMYVIVPKKPEYEGEKYQVHQASSQYMDERDEPVFFVELIRRFPGILPFMNTVTINGRKAIYEVTEVVKEEQAKDQNADWDDDDPVEPPGDHEVLIYYPETDEVSDDPLEVFRIGEITIYGLPGYEYILLYNRGKFDVGVGTPLPYNPEVKVFNVKHNTFIRGPNDDYYSITDAIKHKLLKPQYYDSKGAVFVLDSKDNKYVMYDNDLNQTNMASGAPDLFTVDAFKTLGQKFYNIYLINKINLEDRFFVSPHDPTVALYKFPGPPPNIYLSTTYHSDTEEGRVALLNDINTYPQAYIRGGGLIWTVRAGKTFCWDEKTLTFISAGVSPCKPLRKK